MTIKTRMINSSDRETWDHLWKGYQEFYGVDLSDKTDQLFARMLVAKTDEEGDGPFGMVAEENGKLLGLVHFLYHQTTWSEMPRCYLHDLYTIDAARGKGIGRALIEAVYDHAAGKGADQVYWMTQDFNEQARVLYDKVATLTPFIKYAHKV